MKKIILIVIMTLGFNIAYSQSIELSVISTSGDYFQGTMLLSAGHLVNLSLKHTQMAMLSLLKASSKATTL